MGGPTLTRRGATAAIAFGVAMLGRAARAAAPLGLRRPTPAFTKDPEAEGMVAYAGIHHGKGTVKAKWFRFGGAPAPANFMIYDLPPGASEGTHTHFLDDRNAEGPYDEYYYVMSGQGQMEIDGEIVPVAAGDHVHTPLEVAHGIENTHPTENLRVFLTFIARGREEGRPGRHFPKA